jgi:epoxyqueuosine reductase QueG
MNDIEKIKNLVQEKNYSKKHQFIIISKIIEDSTGLYIPPQTCQKICSLQRSVRFAIPPDEKGLELESKWHAPHYIQNFEVTANNQFKLTL